ncbi:energy-coupling factor ABC transporter ATP-binding protein [Providencia rettgeri]|uniref:energy-coupling factor ABC transporter ATP-binding protein n=1 Tax=Providencia rettgeri TaxID=587 RepID=UPI0034E080B9
MVVNLQQMHFIPQGAKQPLLGPIDIQLKAGQWCCVLGGNGSGKSTLAQLLAGWHGDLLHGELTGVAEVLQQPLINNSVVQASVSRQLIQQSPALQFSGCTFTVEQEIAFGPENLNLSVDEITQRVEHAITLTFCEALRHRHPATLSGGEAQRVVLASALAMRPQLLLLDEAFSRLTPSATQRLLLQLKTYSVQTNCCVMLFERNLLPAIHFCQDFLLLSSGNLFSAAGKILSSGSLETVFPNTLATINMPDAWRVVGELVKLGQWQGAIPRDEKQLVEAFKRLYATTE